MNSKYLGRIAAGLTALAPSLASGAVINNTWNNANQPWGQTGTGIAAASYASVPVRHYPYQQRITAPERTDAWRQWCWEDGNGNKFTLAIDTTSFNPTGPVNGASRTFAKLELDGQVYTTGGVVDMTISRPFNGDNTFGGLFSDSPIQWSATTAINWTDASPEGFMNALSQPGTMLGAISGPEATNFFATTSTPTMLTGMPDIPAPASSIPFVAALAATARRRRKEQPELAR